MPAPDPTTERDETHGLLADDIRALDERIQRTCAEGLSAEAEQLQLKRLRTMAQLARQYRLLARDADVDEMENNVDLLREAHSRD